jgi:hypothetical protein
MCRRCSAVKPLAVAAVPDLPAAAGDAADEVKDAPREMRLLAGRLAAAHRTDPANAILGAELRKTLLELIPKDSKRKPDADLTGLLADLSSA